MTPGSIGLAVAAPPRTEGPSGDHAARLVAGLSGRRDAVGRAIGMELGLIARGVGSALIAAGLLSVVLFPLAALGMLGRLPPPSPRVA